MKTSQVINTLLCIGSTIAFAIYHFKNDTHNMLFWGILCIVFNISIRDKDD